MVHDMFSTLLPSYFDVYSYIDYVFVYNLYIIVCVCMFTAVKRLGIRVNTHVI